jgi:hypothetical protein
MFINQGYGPKMPKKVYCNDCKFCKAYRGGDNDIICKHPENTTVIDVESFFKINFEHVYKKTPVELNAHNACPWYKKRNIFTRTIRKSIGFLIRQNIWFWFYCWLTALAFLLVYGTIQEFL